MEVGSLTSEIINLKSRAAAAMVRHAREAVPDECCGVLLGRGDEIAEALAARNIAEQPAARFVIDPHDHIAGRRDARARGLDVVGFYHSHPRSAPEPSVRDLDEFTYPGHLYAIVSLRVEPAEVALFRFDAGNFQRVSFVTVG